MTTPHIAWAFAQRNLTAAQRVVLIALAERANGERTCFPSEHTLAEDCELSRRSVVAAVQYLRDERRLIEVVTDAAERAEILAKAGARKTARVNVYRILRPADGEKSAPSHRANGAEFAHNLTVREKSAQIRLRESAKSASRECKKQHVECAPFAHEPLNESLHEKKREVASSGKAQPAASPPKAPQLGTTTDSSPTGYIQPGKVGPFADDQPVDPGMALAVLADLRHSLRMRAYPPRAAILSRDEQISASLSGQHVKPAPLSPEHLAAARRMAGIGVMA